MLMGLASDHSEERTVMIDATYLKVHCTALRSVWASSLEDQKTIQWTVFPTDGASQRLYRRAGIAEQFTGRRLVPGSVERQRDTPLHPRSKETQNDGEIR